MVIVSVVGRIELACSFGHTLTYMQALDNIVNYEPKISRSTTQIDSPQTGRYSTFGCFAGVSWEGKFGYTLHEHGFHSYMTEGVMANAMQGGFLIFPKGDECCELWHYEEYRIPSILGYLLQAGGKHFIQSSMKEELKKIEAQLLGINTLSDRSENWSIKWLDRPLFSEIVHDVNLGALLAEISGEIVSDKVSAYSFIGK